MEHSILVVLPVFAMALVGYLCVRFGYVPRDAADGIARFAYYVLLPLLIFRTMARSGLPDSSGPVVDALGSFYLGAAVAMVAAMLLFRILFAGSASERRVAAVGASHGQVALLGVPAVFLILGGNLGQPTFFIVGLHGVAMAVLAGLVAGIAGLSLSGLLGGLWDALARQIMNPLPIALVAGLLHHHLALPMPRIADIVIGEFAQALVAVALFGFGGLVARSRLAASGPTLLISAVKLGVHPAATWLLARELFGLSGSWALAATLLAAMPTTMGADLPDEDGEGDGTVALGAVLALPSLAALAYILRL